MPAAGLDHSVSRRSDRPPRTASVGVAAFSSARGDTKQPRMDPEVLHLTPAWRVRDRRARRSSQLRVRGRVWRRLSAEEPGLHGPSLRQSAAPTHTCQPARTCVWTAAAPRLTGGSGQTAGSSPTRHCHYDCRFPSLAAARVQTNTRLGLGDADHPHRRQLPASAGSRRRRSGRPSRNKPTVATAARGSPATGRSDDRSVAIPIVPVDPSQTIASAAKESRPSAHPSKGSVANSIVGRATPGRAKQSCALALRGACICPRAAAFDSGVGVDIVAALRQHRQSGRRRRHCGSCACCTRGSWLTVELAVPWPAPECCIAGADGQPSPRRPA